MSVSFRPRQRAVSSGAGSTVPVDRSGGLLRQAGMPPLIVVEAEVFVQAFTGGEEMPVVLEEDLLVSDCPPQAFDRDVVEGTPPAAHADLHLRLGQDLRLELTRFGGHLNT